MTKVCSKCKNQKSVNEFHKHKTHKDGYCSECRTCRLVKAKLYYNINSDKIKAKRHLHYKQNSERLIELTSKYTKNRNKTDINFKLIRNLRNRLWYALVNRMWKKNCKFSQYIGLEDYSQLAAYIETKFKPGMSWDNYGEWEMDHIVPLSSAKNEDELYKLSHFLNIQPLWKSENRAKANKT